MTYEQELTNYKAAITPTLEQSPFQVGDKVKCTWITYGEAVFDRKGNLVHIPPDITEYIGIVYFVGKIAPLPMIRVKCKTIKGLCKEHDIDFYLTDIKPGKFEVTLEI